MTSPTEQQVDDILKELVGDPEMTVRDKVVSEFSYWKGRAEGIKEIAESLIEAAELVQEVSPDYARVYRMQALALIPKVREAHDRSMALDKTRADVAAGMHSEDTAK